ASRGPENKPPRSGRSSRRTDAGRVPHYPEGGERSERRGLLTLRGRGRTRGRRRSARAAPRRRVRLRRGGAVRDPDRGRKHRGGPGKRDLRAQGDPARLRQRGRGGRQVAHDPHPRRDARALRRGGGRTGERPWCAPGAGTRVTLGRIRPARGGARHRGMRRNNKRKGVSAM
ncbi:MAG: hypothetical protein AVDCRST_MAG25-2470, partial [uncultured Rubrobacteraceae bacterium]